MKPDYQRHLAQLAAKYDLDLLRVTGVHSQLDVAIAEAAIAELDRALFITGDTFGSTTEAHSMITVTARRSSRSSAPVRTN